MAKYTTSDIINFSIDGNAVKLRDAVNDVMAEKVSEYLESQKPIIAKSIFDEKDA